jgi:hypothetical protein
VTGRDAQAAAKRVVAARTRETAPFVIAATAF